MLVSSGKAWHAQEEEQKSAEREKSFVAGSEWWSAWRPSSESRVHTHVADAGMMAVLSHGPIKAQNGLWWLAVQ